MRNRNDWTRDFDDEFPQVRGLHFGGGGKGGGSSSTTSTQKTVPWKEQQPYLKDVFRQAQGLYGSPGPDYFPGSGVVPFSPQSSQAMNAIFERGMTGSPLTFAGGQQLADTISGNYLNANPWLDQTFNRAANQIRPQVDSLFAGSGRYGSGAHQGVMQEGLNNLATDIYGGNYATERKNQLAATAMAPQFAGMDYADLQAAGNVGAMLEGKAGEFLQDDMNRFNFYQGLPEQKLSQYAQLVGMPGLGSQTTASAPNYTNPLVGAAGGALGGATLGSMLAAEGATGLAAVGGWPYLVGGALVGGLLS